MQGTVLSGRYRLEEVLGRGGMGEVWRGYDISLRRPVAIKLLHPGLDADHRDRERFRREALLAASLSDPHIVTVYDHGEEHVDGRGVMYLVMELLKGRSLGTVCRTGASAVSDVISWSHQICAGLQAAHSAGVVHRDIKPDNIWLAQDGTVKLLDFGIARPADSRAARSLTTTGVAIGTPTYMAPEQARGEAGPRTDLYALGCLMHQLLTGEPPFVGDQWQVLAQHASNVPGRVDAQRPHIPADLADLVAHLLEKEPECRPPDAQSVDNLLSAIARATAFGAGSRADGPSGVVTVLDIAPVRGRRLATAAGATVGSVILALEEVEFAHWPEPWPLISGLLMTAAITLWKGPAAEADASNRGDAPPGQSPVSALLVVLLTIAGTLLILFATALPWWIALLANALGGPLLLSAVEAVRRAARQLGKLSWGLANLAACVGMFNGAVGAALLAERCGFGIASAAGLATWFATSTVIAAAARSH
ncbi:serine/threonine-protein kinase [Streptacidiphilus jiangxiensis]|uniref:non-specific serine/threonine protein kinase n=1 Tax=Streptacidiphilus jiangxiensis TaxID=235985 RepID=A0A1H8ABL6_STRJI|nr:serine/threonine-protein kinase [Streptacidiphilus jiangxiensis]SEM68175.1 serine/threonine protein kinase [Streptacidiphilus jiangxiensis]